MSQENGEYSWNDHLKDSLKVMPWAAGAAGVLYLLWKVTDWVLLLVFSGMAALGFAGNALVVVVSLVVIAFERLSGKKAPSLEDLWAIAGVGTLFGAFWGFLFVVFGKAVVPCWLIALFEGWHIGWYGGWLGAAPLGGAVGVLLTARKLSYKHLSLWALMGGVGGFLVPLVRHFTAQ